MLQNGLKSPRQNRLDEIHFYSLFSNTKTSIVVTDKEIISMENIHRFHSSY